MSGHWSASLVWWLVALSATCWAAPSAIQVPTTTIDLDRLIACLETKATWRDLTPHPDSWASRPDKARQIARKALLNTIQRMQQSGITPSVWLLALRWNCGYAGMIRRMNHRWEYAEHVNNLYYDHDFLRTRL